jgi:hypothetical protein
MSGVVKVNSPFGVEKGSTGLLNKDTSSVSEFDYSSHFPNKQVKAILFFKFAGSRRAPVANTAPEELGTLRRLPPRGSLLKTVMHSPPRSMSINGTCLPHIRHTIADSYSISAPEIPSLVSCNHTFTTAAKD